MRQWANQPSLASIQQAPQTGSPNLLYMSNNFHVSAPHSTTIRLPFESPPGFVYTVFFTSGCKEKGGQQSRGRREHACSHPLPLLPLSSMVPNISPAILETQSMPCWSCYREENKFQHSNDAGGLITQIYFGKETSARKHSDRITRPLLNKPDKHTAVILNSVGALEKKKKGRKPGIKGFDIAKAHRRG